MKTLCVGMMVCDTVLAPVPFDILQRDSVTIKPPSRSCGGDALNVALGLAKLGNQVSIVGRAAKDENGYYLEALCKENGIDTRWIVWDQEYSTAVTFALVDKSGERHFLSENSIFHRLEAEDISEEAISEADIVYFGSAMSMEKMDSGGIRELFCQARQQGKLTVMDAAVNCQNSNRDWMSLLEPALSETDIFFPSLAEAEQLTGQKDPEKIAEYFQKFHMKLLGIKMGSQGCFVTDFQTSRRFSCPPGIKAVDTTGAGDSFMAGLICGISKGWDGYTSAGFATCVAAKNVEAYGGTGGIPNFVQACSFYESCKDNL